MKFDKLLSVRFWVTMMFSITFCVVVFMALDSFLKVAIFAQDGLVSIKEIVMLLLGTLTGFVAGITTKYFDRSDRKVS
jgi:hypothetical protein